MNPIEFEIVEYRSFFAIVFTKVDMDFINWVKETLKSSASGTHGFNAGYFAVEVPNVSGQTLYFPNDLSTLEDPPLLIATKHMTADTEIQLYEHVVKKWNDRNRIGTRIAAKFAKCFPKKD